MTNTVQHNVIRTGLVAMAVAALGVSSAFAQSSIPNPDAWVTNGIVRAIVQSGDITYIGGEFTYVAPNVPYGVPLDAATGLPVAVFPKVNGTVRASVPDGAGGWYIGGQFTQVGTEARNNIAHILSDGTVDPAWNPNAGDVVYVLAVSGTTVYAGGDFTTIGGQTRNRIAALDASGLASAWDPNADWTVRALAVSDTTVYACGLFTSIGGQTRNRIAALDAGTGLATAWNPNADNWVYMLAVSGTTVYAGGEFTTIGGQTRNRIAALDAVTGLATVWNPNANNRVYALAVSGTTVYACGDFTTIGGTTRNRIAALNATGTGTATTWNPNANSAVTALAVSGTTVYACGLFTSIGGQTRNRIAALDAGTGLATAWNPNANDWVWTLAVSGTTVYAGGFFTTIGGATRNRIAALDATGVATAWNPNSNGWVRALAVSGTTVYACGDFTTIGGATRNRIAALSDSTGLATTWNPNANSAVTALAVSGTTVYACGLFTTIGGQTRNRIAALSDSTGLATTWNPNANGSVYALAISDTTVYAGGYFTTIGGQTRNYIAALNATGTGTATTWNPNASSYVYALAVSATTVYASGFFTSIGGQTRNYIAALNATGAGTATTWNPNANDVVMALTVSGTTVYAGGFFATIGGATRNQIAALDASGVATACDPNANGTVLALTVSETAVYAGGAFTTIGGNPQGYYAQFDFPPIAPTAPTNPGADPITTDSIRWTWLDQSSDETGFNVWADPGSADPTTLQTTTAADATDWTMSPLDPNTQYAFQVAATNAEGDSAKTTNYARYTLCGPPSLGDNVTCDKTLSTLYPAGTTFSFTNPAGFGGGSIYRVSSFRYAWDTSPTYTFTGVEPVWNSDPLDESPIVSGDYYLHLQSLNAEDAEGGTLDWGPFQIDCVAPTVAMTSGAVEPTNTSPIPVTVTFSEEVFGFADSDIMPGNGTVDDFADEGGGVYTFNLTPSGEGPVTADIAADVAQDAAGNSNDVAGQFSRTYDVTPPTVEMTSAAEDPTNMNPIPVTVTFSEAVFDFADTDIVTTNGTVSGLSGGPIVFTFDLTPSSEALVAADIAADVAEDAAGNGNDAAAQFSRTYATTGSLHVTITPAGAIAAGAQWRRVGTGTWLDSDVTEADVPPGPWNVEFKDIFGWTQPSNHAVVVALGATTEDTGGYTVLPADIFWGTYLGGTGDDKGNDVVVDPSGNVYATGDTFSSGWVSGGWDASLGGTVDGYVVKLSPAGAHVWSTYLGGSGQDYGVGIAFDTSGNVYVVGETWSSGWVSGFWDGTLSGVRDGYVVKLSSAGAHIWSTYVGGSSGDYCTDIALDASGNIHLAGVTSSVGWIGGGWDGSLGGTADAFVIKKSAAGANLWYTYVGGSGRENLYAATKIALDTNGNVYVTGDTPSSGWLSGGWDTTYGGGDADGFLVKLSAAGAHQWSTYMGGSATDYGLDVAVDANNNVYVTGISGSTGWGVSGGWDTDQNGGNDGYVLKLSSAGAHVWSTYLGGSGDDSGYGVALDSGGNAYTTGRTNSSGWVSGGWDTDQNGGYDGYMVKLSAAGAHLWSSYFGGTADDYAYGIALGLIGNLYVTGYTTSSGWLTGGWDTTYGGGNDGFVVKIGEPIPAAPSNPGATAIGVDAITWTWQDNSTDETGFKVYDDPGAGPPITLQTTAAADEESWVHSGLTPNTEYAFQVAATNANGDSDLTANYARYTLCGPPSLGDNVACDKTVSTLYPDGTTFSFTNPAGFGLGTDGGSVYMVSNFRYAWDTSATYTFTGAEPVWNSDPLDESPIVSGDYYLHLLSRNEEDAEGGTLDYGPFQIDCVAPTVAMTSGAVEPTNTSPIPVTVTFSEAVFNFTDTDIVATNAAVGGFTDVGGGVYTFNLTPSSDGLVSADIGADVAQDAAGNGNEAASQFSRTYDGTSPSVSMTSGAPDPTNTSPIPVTVTFSEAVFGFADTDVVAMNGTVSSFSGGPAVYTFDLIPLSDGPVTADIGVGVAADAANNGNEAAAQFGRTYDTTNPTVNMASAVPDPTDMSPIPITITFSEVVFGFVDTDIAAVNGTVSGIADMGGGVYVFDLTPLGEGLVTADIAAGAALDAAGNPSNAAAQFSRIYDGSIPTNPGAIAIGENTITWTWQDTSSNETGFKVYDDPGAGPPVTLQTTTAADVELWEHNNLNVNTQYAFQVSAVKPYGDSARTSNFTAWTLAATPLAPLVGAPGADTLYVVIGTGDGNPAGTLYAIQVSPDVGGNTWVQADGTVGASAVYQTAAAWSIVAVTGLESETEYAFSVIAQNGAGVDTEPGPAGTGTTLAVPEITEQPVGGSAYVDGSFTFSVTATGGVAPLGYQWRRNGGYVVGATESSLVIDPVAVSDEGGYDCIVSNSGTGSVTSDMAALDVINHISIAQQPQGAALQPGGSYVLSVTAAGGYLPLAYQWKQDGSVLPGATASSYSITSFDEAQDAGTYTVDISDSLTDVVVSDGALIALISEVPVAGLAGLAAAVLAASLLGALRLRRRMK